jgi:hypothetical protein
MKALYRAVRVICIPDNQPCFLFLKSLLKLIHLVNHNNPHENHFETRWTPIA